MSVRHWFEHGWHKHLGVVEIGCENVDVHFVFLIGCILSAVADNQSPAFRRWPERLEKSNTSLCLHRAVGRNLRRESMLLNFSVPSLASGVEPFASAEFPAQRSRNTSRRSFDVNELTIDIHTYGIRVDSVTGHVVPDRDSSQRCVFNKLFRRRNEYYVQHMTRYHVFCHLGASP